MMPTYLYVVACCLTMEVMRNVVHGAAGGEDYTRDARGPPYELSTEHCTTYPKGERRRRIIDHFTSGHLIQAVVWATCWRMSRKRPTRPQPVASIA